MADYTNRDVVQANINGNSSSRWSISPPSRTALVRELRGEQRMSLKFEWYFKRFLTFFLQLRKALLSAYSNKGHLVNMYWRRQYSICGHTDTVNLHVFRCEARDNNCVFSLEIIIPI